MAQRLRAKRFIVHGHVQGVGFRYATVRNAQRFGLNGWVRNNVDGSVEILAEGSPESIARIEKWLKKGPTGSYVTRLDSFDVPISETYSRFVVEY